MNTDLIHAADELTRVECQNDLPYGIRFKKYSTITLKTGLIIDEVEMHYTHHTVSYSLRLNPDADNEITTIIAHPHSSERKIFHYHFADRDVAQKFLRLVLTKDIATATKECEFTVSN